MDIKGYVYFITTASRKVVKIGFSKNVEKRLKQLQTSNEEVLEVLYMVEGTYDTEKYFHRMFSFDRTQGEWFSLSHNIKRWIANDKYIKENDIK